MWRCVWDEYWEKPQQQISKARHRDILTFIVSGTVRVRVEREESNNSFLKQIGLLMDTWDGNLMGKIGLPLGLGRIQILTLPLAKLGN